MKRIFLLAAVFALMAAVFSACANDSMPWPQALDEPLLLPHGEAAVSFIEYMTENLYSRVPFTYREQEAALWIASLLLEMGHPEENVVVQEFHRDHPAIIQQTIGNNWQRMWGGPYMPSRDYSQNVILTVPGQSSRTIIVGAHYDSWPLPGASDNASGTALLLESAWRILDMEHYHTIVYVFFGAEEIAYVGALYYYYNLPYEDRDNIALMINADVLFEGEYFLYGAGVRGQGSRPISGILYENDATRQVSYIVQGLRDVYGISVMTVPRMALMNSDQIVFFDAGHAVVQLVGMDMVGEYGAHTFSVRVLHTRRDCFHYINENWPNKIGDAMGTFGLILERLLAAEF